MMLWGKTDPLVMKKYADAELVSWVPVISHEKQLNSIILLYIHSIGPFYHVCMCLTC